MKAAALILGIAGGILGLFLGLLSFAFNLGIAEYGLEVRAQDNIGPDPVEPSHYPSLSPGIIGMAGGIAGMAGGAFSLRKKRLAGSLMAAGACLSLPSIIGIIAFFPLLAGGMFAFIPAYRDKTGMLKPLSVTLAYCGAIMALAPAILKYLTLEEPLLIAASAAGAVLSAAGGTLAIKHRAAAGILMVASAIACIIGESGILAVFLPLAAAVFMLLPDKSIEPLKEKTI